MVVPSCAVTKTVMVFTPTAKLIEPEAVPEVTEVPLTFTVAVESVTVGVTVIDVVALVTAIAYEVVPVEKEEGVQVPVEVVRLVKLESVEADAPETVSVAVTRVGLA